MTLVEMLVAVAIVGVIVSIAVPSVQVFRRRAAVRAAGARMRSIVRFARSRAIARHANCAIKFRHDPEGWVWLAYDDGDGDGVRNADIRRGIDPLVRGPETVLEPEGPVWIAMPKFPIPDPSSGRRMDRDARAVRFNRSSLASFSPLGSGTPGTVFLSDGHELVAAIRVTGTTGRVRIEWFDRLTGRWSERW